MLIGKRIVRGIARSLIPGKRARHLRAEVDYWRLWFETGGLEWPEDYLDRLNPHLPLQEWIVAYADRIAGSEVEILDVGSGPLTKLGKTHPSKQIAITAVDQLADAYNAMIDASGLAPPVRTVRCDAEELSGSLKGRTFDIVHAENSIDHTQDAVAALKQMLAATRPGGFVLLHHAENEGRKSNYLGLHQWDFACEDGRFVVAGPGRDGARHDMTAALTAEADVECWSSGGSVYVAMRKR